MNRYIAIKETTRGFSKEFIEQGFCLTFANGTYVSVRFGTGNFCDQGVTTAEVAVIDKDDNWYTYYEGNLSMYPEGSEVNSHVSTDDLAEILMLAKKL